MNKLSEFWFFFGAALAAQRMRSMQGARDGIDEAIATVGDLTEGEFLDCVTIYLPPYSEFHDAVVRAAIDLYRDLTFSRAAQWEAAFDAGQVGE